MKNMIFVVEKAIIQSDRLPKLEKIIKVKVIEDGGKKLGEFDIKTLKMKFNGLNEKEDEDED